MNTLHVLRVVSLRWSHAEAAWYSVHSSWDERSCWGAAVVLMREWQVLLFSFSNQIQSRQPSAHQVLSICNIQPGSSRPAHRENTVVAFSAGTGFLRLFWFNSWFISLNSEFVSLSFFLLWTQCDFTFVLWSTVALVDNIWRPFADEKISQELIAASINQQLWIVLLGSQLLRLLASPYRPLQAVSPPSFIPPFT